MRRSLVTVVQDVLWGEACKITGKLSIWPFAIDQSHFCVSCLEVKPWNQLEWNGMNMWWWESALKIVEVLLG